MPILKDVDTPRLSTYLRSCAGLTLDVNALRVEQQKAIAARKRRIKLGNDAQMLRWRFFTGSVQMRNAEDKRYNEMYRELTTLTKKLLVSESSSDEIHSAMFLLYRELEADPDAGSDDYGDDDEPTRLAAGRARVSATQLERLVEHFGPGKARPFSILRNVTFSQSTQFHSDHCQQLIKDWLVILHLLYVVWLDGVRHNRTRATKLPSKLSYNFHQSRRATCTTTFLHDCFTFSLFLIGVIVWPKKCHRLPCKRTNLEKESSLTSMHTCKVGSCWDSKTRAD